VYISFFSMATRR